MIDDELAVFYDTDDFALRCTRLRPGEDDVEFAAILSTIDDDRFDGHLMAGVMTLIYPTAAVSLQTDDIVRAQRADEEPESWVVLRNPTRTVDGAESWVHIRPEEE